MTKFLICVPLRKHAFPDSLKPIVQLRFRSELDGGLPPHLTLCWFTSANEPANVTKKVQEVVSVRSPIELTFPSIRGVHPNGTKEGHVTSLALLHSDVLEELRRDLCQSLFVDRPQWPFYLSIEAGISKEAAVVLRTQLTDIFEPFSYLARSVAVYYKDGIKSDQKVWRMQSDNTFLPGIGG